MVENQTKKIIKILYSYNGDDFVVFNEKLMFLKE